MNNYIKDPLSYFKLTIILFLLPVSFSAFSQSQTSSDQSPQIFHVTTAETHAGDAVLIRGEYLDKVSKIEVWALSNDIVDNTLPSYVPLPHEDANLDFAGTNRRAKPTTPATTTLVDLVQKNKQSVKFVIPSSLREGVYGAKVTDLNNHTTTFYVNIPIVNWVICEEGLKAIAGNYLRIQGKNLSINGTLGQVVLIADNGGAAYRCKVKKAFDNFSVSVDVPANVQPGSYALYFHNGIGGKTAWSEPLKVSVIPAPDNSNADRTFNVKDYGAAGDGTNDETAAFNKAIDAAAQNNGGTIYIPRGRYMLTSELKLPVNSTLKGESQTLTQLFWNSQNWAVGSLPNSLISGTNHFAVKDLNIWASRAWGVIVSGGPLNKQGNITLENLLIRQSTEMSSKVYSTKTYRDALEAELNSKWLSTGIVLSGENVKIRNCDINISGMFNFLGGISGMIQNCKFTMNQTGVNQPYMITHPKGLIFEDCYKQIIGFGYGSTIDESHDLYEARNIIPYNYVNNRESMTLDGGSGGYSGNIISASGNKIILTAQGRTNQWVANRWKGGGIFIIDGKGAGQFRRIIKHGLDTVYIDQPFLVNPDSSSVISITTIRKNLFFVNDEVSDAGAFQFYGSAQNCVVSGLKMQRSGGIESRGALVYNGKQPNWYIDIDNCTLTDGNYSHFLGNNDNHSGYQSITITGLAGSGLNIGALVRRNTLSDFSFIQVVPGTTPRAISDLIVEDNTITTAVNAISLTGTGNNIASIFIQNNHYNGVTRQVDINKSLKVNDYLIQRDGTPDTKEKKIVKFRAIAQ
ncbi:glycosyl hydrolase family 28-related protein [Mucilaginibacter sp.]|uniref:glycosyl hydrolase family 28-related protein n=1 Tax=Mucilaginibacter sp. TaxID=1882438 RepID=UPI003D0F0905